MEPGQKCVILQGIPASGKTTWAKALVLADPSWKRVNRDDIRQMLHAGQWSKDNEKLTKAVEVSSILNALERGYNVLVDNTHTSPKVLRKLRSEVCEVFPAVGWKVIRFDVPLAECLHRNRLRSGHERVPDSTVQRMWMELNNFTMEL